MLCSLKKKSKIKGSKGSTTTFFGNNICLATDWVGISASYLFCQFWNSLSTWFPFDSILLFACYLTISAGLYLSLGPGWISILFLSFWLQDREIKLCVKNNMYHKAFLWDAFFQMTYILCNHQADFSHDEVKQKLLAHIIKHLGGKICSVFPQMFICSLSLL